MESSPKEESRREQPPSKNQQSENQTGIAYALSRLVLRNHRPRTCTEYDQGEGERTRRGGKVSRSEMRMVKQGKVPESGCKVTKDWKVDRISLPFVSAAKAGSRIWIIEQA